MPVVSIFFGRQQPKMQNAVEAFCMFILERRELLAAVEVAKRGHQLSL